eukprot:gnl/MRDRNA2_/MRDRNA2_241595_c0_seq1.p1 gnl/MRDRNA2_/MRDRNA2_241595_c0~~gnl/MRDRNA2_/MRDRNA2_241595_c0_seq1.p1  ORF type:complete len:111 (+),score=22.75 gnl/MRDRNA2_/MRDRNA2_241595_c0_seq1:197-529(+)
MSSLGLVENFFTKTLPELKTLCRERGLPVTGLKAQLVERLEHYAAMAETDESKQHEEGANSLLDAGPILETANFTALTVQKLKNLCRQKGLPVSGLKAQLVERLVKGNGG